ncbi:MAG TPA: hypothetical protein VKY89_08040 [Thermoanaerobaculia bacterium]|nr:hypothetical protein [Thermoanaerobaculia bacterium]
MPESLSALMVPSPKSAAARSCRLAASPPELDGDRALAAACAFASVPGPGGRRAPGGVWRWHVHHAYD